MIFTLVSERNFFSVRVKFSFDSETTVKGVFEVHAVSPEPSACYNCGFPVSPVNVMKRSDLLCFNASMSMLWKTEKTMVGQEFPHCIDVFTHKGYMFLLESMAIRREFHKELERPIMK